MSIKKKDIKNTKELFSELKSNDPKIIVDDDTIKLIPFYWSFGFVINFIPILASVYIVIKQGDLIVGLLCVFVTIISFLNIFNQLKFYNKIIIDLRDQHIIIIPNFIFSFFLSKRIIDFKSIQQIDYLADSIWLGDRRFKIRITIKNSKEKVKVISTSEKDKAVKIIAALLEFF